MKCSFNVVALLFLSSGVEASGKRVLEKKSEEKTPKKTTKVKKTKKKLGARKTPKTTKKKSEAPSTAPSGNPSSQPSSDPSGMPSRNPSSQPSAEPSGMPSSQPSLEPSRIPSGKPSLYPSSQPSREPSGAPSAHPSENPSRNPSGNPSSQPSFVPSVQPSTCLDGYLIESEQTGSDFVLPVGLCDPSGIPAFFVSTNFADNRAGVGFLNTRSGEPFFNRLQYYICDVRDDSIVCEDVIPEFVTYVTRRTDCLADGDASLARIAFCLSGDEIGGDANIEEFMTMFFDGLPLSPSPTNDAFPDRDNTTCFVWTFDCNAAAACWDLSCFLP